MVLTGWLAGLQSRRLLLSKWSLQLELELLMRTNCDTHAEGTKLDRQILSYEKEKVWTMHAHVLRRIRGWPDKKAGTNHAADRPIDRLLTQGFR